jgi:hypothetical protein
MYYEVPVDGYIKVIIPSQIDLPNNPTCSMYTGDGDSGTNMISFVEKK